MINDIVENIQVLGPAFAGIWILTVGLTLLRPQRYFNSFLLMLALMVTMIFLSGFFGEAGPVFLLVCFLLVMLALFLVPVLLIINGVRLIRRESLSPAHLLSLGLGVVVGIGEILWDMLPTGKALGGAPANFAYHAGQFLGQENTLAISALISLIAPLEAWTSASMFSVALLILSTIFFTSRGDVPSLG